MTYSEQPNYPEQAGGASVQELAAQVGQAIEEIRLALDGAVAAAAKMEAAKGGLDGALDGTQNQHALAGQSALDVANTELGNYIGVMTSALEGAERWHEQVTGGAA